MEIFKTTFGISCVRDYNALHKYNLQEISKQRPDPHKDLKGKSGTQTGSGKKQAMSNSKKAEPTVHKKAPGCPNEYSEGYRRALEKLKALKSSGCQDKALLLEATRDFEPQTWP